MIIERDYDGVDEASADSFPASDPPSFTTMHAGGPAPVAVRDDPREPVAWRKPAAIAAVAATATAAVVWLVSRLRRS